MDFYKLRFLAKTSRIKKFCKQLDEVSWSEIKIKIKQVKSTQTTRENKKTSLMIHCPNLCAKLQYCPLCIISWGHLLNYTIIIKYVKRGTVSTMSKACNSSITCKRLFCWIYPYKFLLSMSSAECEGYPACPYHQKGEQTELCHSVSNQTHILSCAKKTYQVSRKKNP